MKTQEARGRCYELAGEWLLGEARAIMGSSGVSGLLLVHGLVNGQGPVSGLRFGHAWIEIEGVLVLYFPERLVPREFYYEVGGIVEADLVRYTAIEAVGLMLEHGHFGPWEKRFEAVRELKRTA